MTEHMDAKLRDEIIECQRARSEFIRWKLILVAALGAVGLGLDDIKHAEPIVLALIPPVCIYVDSVCVHNDSRIMMIAQFMRESSLVSPSARAYETHCHENREMFLNEGLALFYASLFLSAIVLAVGVQGAMDHAGDVVKAALTVASGTLGLCATVILSINFGRVQRGARPLRLRPWHV